MHSGISAVPKKRKQSNVATHYHIYVLLSIVCPTYVKIARVFSCNVVR